MEQRFYILVTDENKDDVEGTLAVKITDEGIICDVEVDGEVVATWGATAQEMADDFCH